MDRFNRNTIAPDKCGGNPSIRGKRFTVRRVVELMDIRRDRVGLIRDQTNLRIAFVKIR